MTAHSWALAAVSLCLGLGAAAGELAVDGRYAMGTLLEVSIPEPGVPEGDPRVFDLIFGEVERLENKFSSYRESSELRSLNARAGSGMQPVSREMAELLKLADSLSKPTDGVFDVTVGPLISLWVDAAGRNLLPSDDEIAARRQRVGSEKLEWEGDRLALPEGMAVDFGGIAKGYALDRVARLLSQRGVVNALLSFGESSTLALGGPADAPGWQLLIRGVGTDYVGTVSLRDQALSVSGSLGKSSEIEGRRIGHVIDPRSGRPVDREVQAVVLAPTAAEAEVWSTALLVLDTSEGLARVEGRPGVEALLVSRSPADGSSKLRMSSGFRRETAFVPADDSVVLENEGRR